MPKRPKFGLIKHPLYLEQHPTHAVGALVSTHRTLEAARQAEREAQAATKAEYGPDVWLPTATGRLEFTSGTWGRVETQCP